MTAPRPLTPAELAAVQQRAEGLRGYLETCDLAEIAHDVPDLLATIAALQEQLRRSATVCPKDGCMLWRGHVEEHATQEQLSSLLATIAERDRQLAATKDALVALSAWTESDIMQTGFADYPDGGRVKSWRAVDRRVRTALAATAPSDGGGKGGG